MFAKVRKYKAVFLGAFLALISLVWGPQLLPAQQQSSKGRSSSAQRRLNPNQAQVTPWLEISDYLSILLVDSTRNTPLISKDGAINLTIPYPVETTNDLVRAHQEFLKILPLPLEPAPGIEKYMEGDDLVIEFTDPILRREFENIEKRLGIAPRKKSSTIARWTRQVSSLSLEEQLGIYLEPYLLMDGDEPVTNQNVQLFTAEEIAELILRNAFEPVPISRNEGGNQPPDWIGVPRIPTDEIFDRVIFVREISELLESEGTSPHNLTESPGDSPTETEELPSSQPVRTAQRPEVYGPVRPEYQASPPRNENVPMSEPDDSNKEDSLSSTRIY